MRRFSFFVLCMLFLAFPIAEAHAHGGHSTRVLRGLDAIFDVFGNSTINGFDDINITSVSDNQSLTWDAATSKWVNETVAGGGSPGGLDTYVQFNDSSLFGGDAGFVYNKTTNTATLGVLDIPASLSFVGRYHDATKFYGWGNMDVYGNRAYILADGTTLAIIDVSIPTTPVLLGTWTTPATAERLHDVKVRGDYAYCIHYTFAGDSQVGQLTILDISDPTSISIVGTLTPLDGFHIDIVGNYVYVASQVDDAFKIIDVSNPLVPVQVGIVTHSTNLADCCYVKVVGEVAYVTKWGVSPGFVTIDISDKTAPSIISIYTTGFVDFPRGIEVSGNLAYTDAGNGVIRILDVSDPASISLVGTYTGSNVDVIYLSLYGKYLAASYFTADEVVLIDVSDPTTPTLHATFADATHAIDSHGLCAVGKYLYIQVHGGGAGTEGLVILDAFGFEIHGITTGSIKTHDLYSQTIKSNTLFVRNGVMVGSDGISSMGPISIQNINPFLVLSDISVGTKALKIDVDADIVQIRAADGAANSLLNLDLANNRVAFFSAIDSNQFFLIKEASVVAADPSKLLHVSGSVVEARTTLMIATLIGQVAQGIAVTNLIGMGIDCSAAHASASITNLKTLDLTIGSFVSGGVITNADFINIVDPIATGTITNVIGVRIARLTTGGTKNIGFCYGTPPASGDYAIYTDANDNVCFMANAGIGIVPIAGTRLLLPQEDDAVTPTLAFGDGNTGFYERVDNVIAVSSGGVIRYEMTSVGIASKTAYGFDIRSGAGSATDPTYRFINDPDTGIGRGDVDILSLITGGIEAIRIDTSQNIGVGTPTPSWGVGSPEKTFHVNYDGDGFPAIVLERENGSTKTNAKYSTYISSAGDYAIYDHVAGSNRLLLNPSGQIGINWDALTVRFEVRDSVLSPTGVHACIKSVTGGLGDNTTFIGVSGGYFQARDDATVASGTKGVLYGLQASVFPRIARDNSPWDDVVCLVLQNDGTAKGTDCFYIGHNSGISGSEFVKMIQIDGYADTLFQANGTYTTGLKLYPATISGDVLMIPNDCDISGRNAANSADINIVKINASDQVDFFDGLMMLSASIVEITSTAGFYYGDSVTDTSWRTIRSGTKLSFQRRESSAWVEKGFFDTSFHADAFHAETSTGVGGSLCIHPGTTPDAHEDGPRFWVDGSGDLYLLEQNATPTTKVQNRITFENAAAIAASSLFLGEDAGQSHTNGTNNVGAGKFALQLLTTGGSNTALGYRAGGSITTAIEGLFLGNQAGYNETASGMLYIANGADGGTKANTWIYGDNSYNVEVPNGNLISKTIHDVSSEGLLLAMNFNSDSIDGTTALDSSGENNHGTVTGATWSATSGFNGGGAYTFNGTSDEIVVSDIITNTAFTVSAWIRSDDVFTQRQAIFEKNMTGSTGFMLEINAGLLGKVQLFNAYGPLTSDTILASDTWYHIVGTYDGTTHRIYINGVLDVSEAATYGTFGTEALAIGHGTFPDDSYFDGTIDEPRAYNRALSADEIAQLYHQRAETKRSSISQKSVRVDTNNNLFDNTIYAQLNSSVNQIPSTTDPVVITYNTQDAINGLTHSTTVNPGEITIDTAGMYFVSPQPQVGKDSGGVKVDFDMFLQVDSGSGFADEDNSNIKLSIKDADITDVIVSAFTIQLNVGDKIRMMQKTSTTGVGMGLKNTDPVTGPPSVPRTPSIIFTMYRIGG